MSLLTGKKNLLALEPYYGGSHRFFLDGMARQGRFSMEVRSLPAHSWKWRMRFAAPFFAATLPASASYDCVLCSSMLDVAALRGIGPAWLKSTRLVSYFHENQFVYPVRHADRRDLHFAITNLTTAAASDWILFNSAFNQRTFFTGSEELLALLPDMREGIDLAKLMSKSSVLAPGIDFRGLDAVAANPVGVTEEGPLLIWNHRWEYDKNPDLFFECLFALQKKKFPFKVALLGQSFRNVPEIFEKARQQLQESVIHFGFVPRERYVQWLHAGTVVISTALHEFFGMAVLEAVRAGCRPLLPARLSYPELFDGNFLYKDEELAEALTQAFSEGRLAKEQALWLTEPFSWNQLLGKYETIFFG
ncbi:MAG: DUF3524 domain-containing protein [Deltaproteobacteria bacterium]